MHLNHLHMKDLLVALFGTRVLVWICVRVSECVRVCVCVRARVYMYMTRLVFTSNSDRNGFVSTPAITIIGNIATTEKG